MSIDDDDDDDDSAGPSTAPAGPSGSRKGKEREQDEAPRYRIAPRDLAAVEIPAVVENIDRAVKAFGRVPTLAHVLDPTRSSIPLYMNPESPFCRPLMSHNAASHNVVLQITVPKRTGRRRKKGSNGPWEGDVEIPDASAKEQDEQSKVQSYARLDEPKLLRRKLADNVGRYEVEAIGTIRHTHRFRALADFYWDMNQSDFAQRFASQVLPGDVEKLKQFSFNEGLDRGPNVDIIPPPIFTHMSLPFNYFYSQNPYVRTTEDGDTVNLTAVKQVGHLISADDPTPQGPQIPPDINDPRTPEVLAELDKAFKLRPLWTRRSLMNHLQGKLHSWNELKKYLNYAAYQFKGGPWRDSVVPYGLDPRLDPKYRVYQTLMFKLEKHKRSAEGRREHSAAEGQQNATNMASRSHIFDGSTYSTDGKVWQVCDITDPLLKGLLENATIRPECDVNSGWYHGGLWAKVKAIMKTQLVAIQFGRRLSEADFVSTLSFGDMTPPRSTSNTFHLPLPDLHLTDDELTTLRGRNPPAKKKSKGYNVRFRNLVDSPSVATEQSPTPLGIVDDDGRMEYGNEGFASEEDEDGESENDAYTQSLYVDQVSRYDAPIYQDDEEGDGAEGEYVDVDADDDVDDDDVGMNQIHYPDLD